MKTLRLLGVVLMAVMLSINLTSCGDDDDEKENPSNPLVGTWITKESTDYYQIVFNSNGSAIGTYTGSDGKQYDGSISYTYTYDDASKAFTLTESTTKVKGYYTASFNSAKTVVSLTFTKVDGDEEVLEEVTDLTMKRVAEFDWHKQ